MELMFNPEEKIQCPYDKAHFIMRKRMNTHLTKCKKNFPVSNLLECDFNVNHKIPEPELQYHHENCPDRYKVEHTFYVEEGKTVNKFPVQNIAVEAEESWDYLNATSYDPNKYCESTGVLRHLDVASAATRKNFRMEERHRLSQLNSSSNNTARLVQPDSNQSTARNTVPGLRRNLPDIPNATTVEENTPELVNELIKRLNLGKNKSFIPKTRVGQ